MMSRAGRRAARGRCKNATPGPWKFVRSHSQGGGWRERYYEIWTEEGGKDDRPIAHMEGDNAIWLCEGEDLANALFVAHARSNLPAALDHIDSLEKERVRLRTKVGRLEKRLARAQKGRSG